MQLAHPLSFTFHLKTNDHGWTKLVHLFHLKTNDHGWTKVVNLFICLTMDTSLEKDSVYIMHFNLPELFQREKSVHYTWIYTVCN